MSLKHQRIIITGGAGFIGTQLANYLAAHNLVTVIDHKIGSVVGVKYHEGNLNQLNLKRILKNQDILFHLAWSTTPALKISWRHELAQNVYPTQKLINQAKESGIKHLVFVSSAGAIYGDNPTPFTEDQTPHPVSNYGKSKLKVEKVLAQAATADFKVTVFRPTNIIGPAQKFRLNQGIVPAIIKAHQHHQSFTVWGNATKDYLAVDDAVKAMSLIDKQLTPFDIYNLASGTILSTLQILDLSDEVFGSRLKLIHQPPASHDINRLEASIVKVKKTLGWHPTAKVRQIIKSIFADSIQS